MAKFKSPDGVTSVSIGGAEYNVDKRGELVVPDDVDASALRGFGFERLADAVIKKAKEDKPADAAAE